MPSQNFQWLIVDELEKVRTKSQGLTRQHNKHRGDPNLKSWRMLGEEDAEIRG